MKGVLVTFIAKVEGVVKEKFLPRHFCPPPIKIPGGATGKNIKIFLWVANGFASYHSSCSLQLLTLTILDNQRCIKKQLYYLLSFLLGHSVSLFLPCLQLGYRRYLILINLQQLPATFGLGRSLELLSLRNNIGIDWLWRNSFNLRYLIYLIYSSLY